MPRLPQTPPVDGFELLKFARRPRRHPELQRLVIVVLTASDSPRDKELAAEFGSDHYLVKFPLPQIIVEIVETASRL